MPWKVSYQQDTEKPGTGTTTAVFADQDGNFVVSYARRLDTDDGKDISDFLTEANAVKDKHTTDRANADAVVAKVEAILNQ